jgi:general secretion pathway protein K
MSIRCSRTKHPERQGCGAHSEPAAGNARAAVRFARKQERGGALLAVLWISAALAAIALSVSTSIRSETDRAGTAADGMRTSYLATGSVDRAMQWLFWGTAGGNRFFDYLHYEDKPRLYFTYPSGDVVVEMMPEAAKLDINHASNEDILRVVAAVTGDPARARQITEGIMGWRGGSGSPSTDSSGQGSTFQPRGASFEEIEELLLVHGMTPELFYGNYVADGEGRLSPRGGLRDSLSVWGSLEQFDANAASPALLEALGASPAAATQMVQQRARQPFTDLGQVAALGIPVGRLSLRGEHLIWNIRATARLKRPNGAPSDVVRSASAIVKLVMPPRTRRLDPIKLRVLRFYEDAWSEFAPIPVSAPAAPTGVLLP